MAEPKKLEEVDLPGETLLKLDDSDADFERAEAAAYEQARKYDSEPLLLAWHDKLTGRQSPNMSCDEEGGDPGWVNYAVGHGGNLTVSVNNRDYVFVFKSKNEFTR